jgi:hypothetical protein
MTRRKIPVSAIERLQRTLESTPECRIEEVTKVEAIRMLRPQILAMRAKGYGLGAIAGLLSEHGIAVTAVTLKSYLKQFKGAGGKKSAGKIRPRPGLEDAAANVLTGPSSSAQGVHDRGAPPSSKAGREVAAEGAREAPAGASSQGAAPVATTSKGSPRPAEGGAPRRSAFLPREDTEDI